MALCGVGALAAMSLALRALNASVERTAAALAFFALAPLVLGSVILYRYDLWPAALTVAGLAAVLARRATWLRGDRLGVVRPRPSRGHAPSGSGLRLADVGGKRRSSASAWRRGRLW
jgi:hypothetical protein